MADSTAKQKSPPYVSFTAFVNFLNRLRESHIPGKIDRTVFGKGPSGSLVAAMVSSMKYLELIDEANRPTSAMRALVEASDDARKPLFAEMVKTKYGFLFGDPDFDLAVASTGQVTEKFREQEVSGSTITKAIAFFLGLARAGDFKVSSHIKPPAVARKVSKSVARKGTERGTSDDEREDDEDEYQENDEDPTAHRFEIPIPGKSSVKVIVPNDLDADDWEMLQSVFVVYIRRWKGFKPTGEGGPT